MSDHRALDVYWNQVLVGQFREVAFGVAAFSYEPGYESYPISVSMPVQADAHEGPKVYSFLANLVPDNRAILGELARAHRVDPTDVFGLLGKVGRECAGALVLSDPEEPIEMGPGHYEPVALETIHGWRSSTRDRPTLLSSRRPVRLSLAGVQAKGALYFDADDRPCEPRAGAATTHIVKPQLAGFRPNTVFVECYTMRLARAALGEESAPPVDIWESMYRVRRFDRRIDAAGDVVRLHQEDLCQALGLSPAVKYETDTRSEVPFVARIGRLLEYLDEQRLIESLAAERARLVARLVANVLLANADSHLKNFGLLYTENNLIRVAPLYDVVCTSVLEVEAQGGHHAPDEILYQPLDNQAAIRIGDSFDLQAVTRSDWADAARQLGVKPGVFFTSIEEIAEAIRSNLETTAEAVIAEAPRAEQAVERTARTINVQADRIATESIHAARH